MAKTARPPPAQRLQVVSQAGRAGSDAARPTVTSIRYTARRWVCSASMNKKAASDDFEHGKAPEPDAREQDGQRDGEDDEHAQ